VNEVINSSLVVNAVYSVLVDMDTVTGNISSNTTFSKSLICSFVPIHLIHISTVNRDIYHCYVWYTKHAFLSFKNSVMSHKYDLTDYVTWHKMSLLVATILKCSPYSCYDHILLLLPLLMHLLRDLFSTYNRLHGHQSYLRSWYIIYTSFLCNSL